MASVTHLTNQSQFVQSNAAFNGTNISGTIASNGISLSVAPGGGGADGYNILAAGTQTANTTGTVLFNNANGVTFGMSNNSVITASHNGLTTAMASNRGTDFVQATAAFAGTNATGTIASNGISVSVAPQTAFVFSNSNGVTFGTNGSTVTASHNGLTSQSNQAFSASGGSSAFQTLNFANSNGITFSNSNGSVIASHNGLTTARASNDGVGLNTAQSNVTWTVNSSGISLDGRGYAGTGSTFNGTNVSGSVTLNSNGLRLDLSAAAPGGGGGIALANSQTTYTSGTANLVVAGGAMTIASTTGQSFNFSVPATSSFVAVGNATLSTNGSTISISVDSIAAAPVNFSAGTTSGNLGSVVFSNSNGVSFGLNGSTITATVATNYLTTAMASNRGSDFVQATAAFAGTNASGTIASNGISVSVGNYITTARASNDAVGLNTAGTNVTWTVNSSGISFNGAGYAGTGTTFGGTNISGSITQNSNGIALSLSAGAAGGGATYAGFDPTLNTPVSPVLAAANGSVMFMPVSMPNVSFSRIDAPLYFSNATNSTGQYTASIWVGVYTRNSASLSLLSSISTSVGITGSGTVNNSLYAGVRMVTMGSTGTFTQGDYWLGYVHSTSSSSANATIGFPGVSIYSSNVGYSGILGVGSVTNGINQLNLGMGYFATNEYSMRNSVAFTNIIGSIATRILLRKVIFNGSNLT